MSKAKIELSSCVFINIYLIFKIGFCLIFKHVPMVVPGINAIPDAIPAFIIDTPNCACKYFTTNGPSPVEMTIVAVKASVLNTNVMFLNKVSVAGMISESFPWIRLSSGRSVPSRIACRLISRAPGMERGYASNAHADKKIKMAPKK